MMTIQRKNGEIIITIPDNVETVSLQRLIDCLKYNEVTANNKATQKQIDSLSTNINQNWWDKNKNRLLGK